MPDRFVLTYLHPNAGGSTRKNSICDAPPYEFDETSLLDWLATPVQLPCDVTDMEKGGSVDRAKDSVAGWLPITLKHDSDQRRTDQNVHAVHALVLDFDNSSRRTLDALLDRCDDLQLQFFWHTSFSSGLKGKGFRFRLVLPLSEPVPGHTWRDFWGKAVDYVVADLTDGLDASCSNPSKFYYGPSVPTATADAYEWDYTLHDAARTPLDVAKVQAHEGSFLAPTKAKGPKAKKAKPGIFAPGQNHDAALKRSSQLVRAGFDQETIVAKVLAEAKEGNATDFADIERTARAGSSGNYVKPAFNDHGIAMRIAKRADGCLRYYTKQGQWYLRNGHEWVQVDELTARDRAAFLAKESLDEERKGARDDDKEGYDKALFQLGNNSKSRAVFAEFKQLPDVHVQHTAHLAAHQLRCKNGVVDLRTGELFPSNPDDFFLQSTGVNYKPEAINHPRLLLVLEQIAQSHEALRALHTHFGYCATGDVTEQKWLYLKGRGANGKSLLMGAVAKALGGYAASLPKGMLQTTHYNAERHPTDFARLAGVRFLYSSELDSSKVLDDVAIKMLVSGENITARFMHKDSFEFAPELKVCLAANIDPHVKDSSDGFWRRIALMEFTANFQANPDRDLAGLTVSEEGREFFLAWLVAGAREYYATGLHETEAMRAQTQTYRVETDHVRQFLSDCCRMHPDARARRVAVYQRFRSWCEAEGIRYVLGKIMFFRRLADLGFDHVKIGHASEFYFVGFDLIALDISGRYATN